MLKEGIKTSVYSSVASVGGATNHKQMHASSSLIYHPSDSFVILDRLVKKVMQVYGLYELYLHPYFLFNLLGFKRLG